MNNAPWYDCAAGIAEHCTDLKKFNQLLVARSKGAGRAPGEDAVRLNEWIIKGTWHLDTFGQTGRMSKPRFYEEQTRHYVELSKFEFPMVVSKPRFGSTLPQGLEWEWGYSLGDGGPPPDGQRCPCCMKTWSMVDSGNTYLTKTSETIPLSAFVGQALEEVRGEFATRKDALYFMQPDIVIRNDRWVDHTPDEKYSTLEVNKQGWSSSNTRGRAGWPEIDYDGYEVQPGDEAHFNVWTYYHPECWAKKLSSEVTTEFYQAFDKAGIAVDGVVKLHNEYGSTEYRGPWFLFDTDQGIVKVGWRKRVITLEFWGTPKEYAEGFSDDFTKRGGHFNTYAEFSEYLKANTM